MARMGKITVDLDTSKAQENLADLLAYKDGLVEIRDLLKEIKSLGGRSRGRMRHVVRKGRKPGRRPTTKPPRED